MVLVEIPPVITQHPENNFDANLFDEVVLTCDASGQPSPTLRWLKDGRELEITGNKLEIAEVALPDRGNYTCVAKNMFGEVFSRSAIVNIRG